LAAMLTNLEEGDVLFIDEIHRLSPVIEEILQFTGNSAIAEAEAALQSLGYKPLEAQKLVNAVKGDLTEAGEIIRAALKSMNR